MFSLSDSFYHHLKLLLLLVSEKDLGGRVVVAVMECVEFRRIMGVVIFP